MLGPHMKQTYISCSKKATQKNQKEKSPHWESSPGPSDSNTANYSQTIVNALVNLTLTAKLTA